MWPCPPAVSLEHFPQGQIAESARLPNGARFTKKRAPLSVKNALAAYPDVPENRPAEAVAHRVTEPVPHNHAPRGAMTPDVMGVTMPDVRMRVMRRARPGLRRAMLGQFDI